ncbi:MAG: outer membrane lipoprotein-sorting protein [Mariprofundaceae bacterium]|nr:outer membrane lipoprotein-sorting protein [Mariprofundaceae bacterium]
MITILLLSAMLIGASEVQAGADSADWSGHKIILTSLQKHQYYPYVFEQQTMILMDQHGHRDVRSVRRFSRLDEDGTARFVLVFDYPEEVSGVSLLVEQQPEQVRSSQIYLPAFGKRLIRSDSSRASQYFMGSDFSLRQIMPEKIEDYHYQRGKDLSIQKTPYFRLTALPLNALIARNDGYAKRELLLRQDNLCMVRVDYFNHRGRLFKRLSAHDLQQINGPMWRANMLLMEDFERHHKTLIKIENRVFSRDYVPRYIFTAKWLMGNHKITQINRLLQQGTGKN